MTVNGENITYLYDANDSRMYKQVDTTLEEYYLKDLGVLDMKTGNWSYYLSGTERFLRIEPDSVHQPKYNASIDSISISNGERFYYETDHLGNTRIVFTPRDVYFKYIHFASDFYPYGKILREYVSVPEKYLFTSKQRDEETELDYFGARFFDSDIARFEVVDPMGGKRVSWSLYNYCQANPIMRIDPTGALDEPVFGSDGTFRGTTKEGYTGEVIIYDGNKDFSNMAAADLLYDESFDVGKQRGDANTYDRVRNELSGNAKSKIWTHIASQIEGKQIYDETFSMKNLVGGKIYFDKSIGNASWQSSYSLGSGRGKISGSDKYSYESTVENIQSSIGVHEYYSHIMKNQGDNYLSHRLAYKNVINFKALWNKTTDAYKGFNVRLLLKYTIIETGRAQVDPLYKNLYEKYYKKY